jgi:hypothetical protein
MRTSRALVRIERSMRDEALRLKGSLSMPYELSDKCAPAPPHCSACAQAMRLARITSRFDDLPDLYVFECRACGMSHIEAAHEFLPPEIPERLSA